MEKKFEGSVFNGFLMLFVTLALTILSIAWTIIGIIMLSDDKTDGLYLLFGGIALLIFSIIMMCGFLMLEPDEARVLTWFGKYAGTCTETG